MSGSALATNFFRLKLFLVIFVICGAAWMVVKDSVKRYVTVSTEETFGSRLLSPEREQFVRGIAKQLEVDFDFKMRAMNAATTLAFSYANAFVYFPKFFFVFPIKVDPYIFLSDTFFDELSEAEQRFLIGHELIHLKHGQWVTASALAFSHGANDAQKGMGIITLCLFLAGYINEFSVPMWVIILSALSMTIGTMLGGWRIVRTVGFGIYKLRALHGFNTQLTSAGVIFGASLFGGPVSTTHVVSTAIMGIGASEHPRAVHWAKAKEILLTWVLTLPCAAVLSCAIYSIVNYLIYLCTRQKIF